MKKTINFILGFILGLCPFLCWIFLLLILLLYFIQVEESRKILRSSVYGWVIGYIFSWFVILLLAVSEAKIIYGREYNATYINTMTREKLTNEYYQARNKKSDIENIGCRFVTAIYLRNKELSNTLVNETIKNIKLDGLLVNYNKKDIAIKTLLRFFNKLPHANIKKEDFENTKKFICNSELSDEELYIYYANELENNIVKIVKMLLEDTSYMKIYEEINMLEINYKSGLYL